MATETGSSAASVSSAAAGSVCPWRLSRAVDTTCRVVVITCLFLHCVRGCAVSEGAPDQARQRRLVSWQVGPPITKRAPRTVIELESPGPVRDRRQQGRRLRWDGRIGGVEGHRRPRHLVGRAVVGVIAGLRNGAHLGGDAINVVGHLIPSRLLIFSSEARLTATLARLPHPGLSGSCDRDASSVSIPHCRAYTCVHR